MGCDLLLEEVETSRDGCSDGGRGCAFDEVAVEKERVCKQSCKRLFHFIHSQLFCNFPHVTFDFADKRRVRMSEAEEDRKEMLGSDKCTCRKK